MKLIGRNDACKKGRLGLTRSRRSRSDVGRKAGGVHQLFCSVRATWSKVSELHLLSSEVCVWQRIFIWGVVYFSVFGESYDAEQHHEQKPGSVFPHSILLNGEEIGYEPSGAGLLAD